MTERDGRSPRRIIDKQAGSRVARLLASAARPVDAPAGARERIFARVQNALGPQAHLASTGARSFPVQPVAGGRRHARAWLLASLAAGCAAVVVIAGIKGKPAHEAALAELASAGGEVQASGPAGAPAAARVGALFRDGSTVRTAPSGRAELRFADLQARLGEKTAVTLRRDAAAGGVELALAEGEVMLAVERRAPVRSVVISVRGYRVAVVGTVFSVRAPPDGTVEVTVREGAVRVSGPDSHRRLPLLRVLRAGETWTSGARGASAAETEPPPAMAPRAAAQALRSDRSAATAPARADRARRHDGVALSGPHAPDRQAVAPAAAPAPPLAPSLPLLSPLAPPAPAPPAVTVSAAPQPAPTMRPPAAPEPSRYDIASALATAGRHAEAAQAFADMARTGAAQADLALYQAGRLLLRQLRDPARAAAAFRDYQRRYPHGALRPEVDLFLVETLLEASRLDEAGLEIERFLAFHSASERREEVRLLRAHVTREKGDCRRAAADYDALSIDAGRVGDEALYFSAYCRGKVGDRAGARRRLTDYLARFPAGRYRGDAVRALGDSPD